MVTDQGTIQTEIVVNAASGFMGTRVGKLVGLSLPVVPMAHLYLMTLPIEGVDHTRRPCATRPAGLLAKRSADCDGWL